MNFVTDRLKFPSCFDSNSNKINKVDDGGAETI